MRFYLFSLLFIGVLFSCNEEITVGSSLLEDGAVELDYTDTLALRAKTVYSDPVVSFRNSTSFSGSTYLLGELNDPVFGHSFSELYLSTNLVDNVFPNFDSLKIDSVVMVLPLDTLGQFGNESAVHTIEVYQLSERLMLDSQDTLFSNDRFDTEAVPMGSLTTLVAHKDSVDIFSVIADSIVRIPPQLRIPLDTSLWSSVVRDTSIINNHEIYEETLRGFMLRSQTQENSFFGIDLSASSAVSIELYYSANDTTHNVYLVDLASIRSNYFEHDYSMTDVELAVSDSSASVLYLQEMQGVNIELDISSVKEFSDRVINRATIELFALEEMDPIVSPINLLQVSYVNEDGRLSVIRDNLLDPSTSISVFGGSLDTAEVNGVFLNKYSFDLSNHVNFIISGEIQSSKILIQSANKSRGASRSIIYGPEHPDYPAKFKLVSSLP
jgi:hypothetical protein